MKNLIKKVLIEPLFHFCVLGGVLYIYFSISNVSSTDTKELISISKNSIKSKYNQEDKSLILESLIQVEYHKKILLEEAYKRGLLFEDENIINQLIHKMQYIVDSKSQDVEPSEEELYKYYQENIDDYSQKKSLSFYHVFLKNANSTSIESISKVLEKNHINKNDASSLGDAFKQNYYKSISPFELESMFGKYFTLRIMSQKKGFWSKEIPSKYGLHFVYISYYALAQKYDFNEVIERVHEDYLLQRTKKKRKEFFKKMEVKYTLEVVDD